MSERDSRTVLTYPQVKEAGLEDWRWLVNRLHARFATGDFATGVNMVNRIAEAAEAMNHHPDLDLRYTHLMVRLVSHDVGGVTDRDLRLARRISEIAAELGVAAAPHETQLLELALDSADADAIRPFWAAVLGLEVHEASGEVYDPDGRVTTLWFQPTEPHAEPRQRFHLDIVVSPEVAGGRIEAALAAGGTLVSDAAAPAFTILADREGNKVCVCTSEGRD